MCLLCAQRCSSYYVLRVVARTMCLELQLVLCASRCSWYSLLRLEMQLVLCALLEQRTSYKHLRASYSRNVARTTSYISRVRATTLEYEALKCFVLQSSYSRVVALLLQRCSSTTSYISRVRSSQVLRSSYSARAKHRVELQLQSTKNLSASKLLRVLATRLYLGPSPFRVLATCLNLG